MSLAPNFVLWAVICFTLLLIAGAIAWLAAPQPLRRALGRLWLSDLAAAWLVYAALYHLAFAERLALVIGPPHALWLLCGGLGVYLVLRRVPSPARRPEVLFALAVLLWAGAISAGARYVDEMDADAALLAERPERVVAPDAASLRPLRRVVVLTRIDPQTRDATLNLLDALAQDPPPAPQALSAFRLTRVPILLEHHRHDLAKLRTYQWLQIGLLAALLLVWGFGRVPQAV